MTQSIHGRSTRSTPSSSTDSRTSRGPSSTLSDPSAADVHRTNPVRHDWVVECISASARRAAQRSTTGGQPTSCGVLGRTRITPAALVWDAILVSSAAVAGRATPGTWCDNPGVGWGCAMDIGRRRISDLALGSDGIWLHRDRRCSGCGAPRHVIACRRGSRSCTFPAAYGDPSADTPATKATHHPDTTVAIQRAE